MPRRDAFSPLRQPAPVPADHAVPEPAPTSALPARQPLDLIPVASRKAKRNREWDRIHRAEKATYRGVPTRMQEAVNALANQLGVPRDELARALLEFGLAHYQTGGARLVAQPKAQRMTLYPQKADERSQSGRTEVSSAAQWLDDAFPDRGRHGKKRPAAGAVKKDRWKVRVTYRLPVDLQAQIKTAASEHDVAIGEVVLYFLDYGLRAYQTGELILSPSPKATGKTLYEETEL